RFYRLALSALAQNGKAQNEQMLPVCPGSRRGRAVPAPSDPCQLPTSASQQGRPWGLRTYRRSDPAAAFTAARTLGRALICSASEIDAEICIQTESSRANLRAPGAAESLRRLCGRYEGGVSIFCRHGDGRLHFGQTASTSSGQYRSGLLVRELANDQEIMVAEGQVPPDEFAAYALEEFRDGAAGFAGSRDRNRRGEHACVVCRILRGRHLTPSPSSRGLCRSPDHASKSHCLFSSRLAAGKIVELERPRRHPKAFGTPSNFSLRDPFERPVPSLRRM